MQHFCPSVVFWNNTKDNSDLAAKVKDRSKYYFQSSPRNRTSSLSLSYRNLYICLPGETMFPWDMLKWRGRKKSISPSFRFHDILFSLSHFLILLKMQKKISHKQLTCLQQNSEDMHKAGSPQKFLGMEFHRTQASTDHRKVLSCCVDKPVKHGKKSFCIYSWWFFSPWGIPAGVCMQYNIQGDSHEEQSRTS